MQLRYFRLCHRRPLEDVQIIFQRERLLQEQQLAIHFVVGVNGTGKTRLLQALAETFIALETDPKNLSIPVTLAYDRQIEQKNQTIYFDYSPDLQPARAFALFETPLPPDTDWSKLAQGLRNPDTATKLNTKPRLGDDVPDDLTPFLPRPLLVYTSGDSSSWDLLFNSQDWGDSPTEISLENETPPDWDIAQQRDALRTSGLLKDAELLRTYVEPETETRSPHASVFLAPEQLKLAVCAVTLEHAWREWQSSTSYPPDKNLQSILQEVDWREPLTLTFNLNFQPDQWSQSFQNDAEKIYRLYHQATTVRRDPGTGKRRQLVFDLGRTRAEETSTLLELLGGPTPIEVFNTLRRWQQAGILNDLSITLHKHSEPTGDLLLFDWLSDGERLFLGRIAVFYLLRGRDDALLILDEPENHFNDYWKHKLVDILADALGQQQSEVLISTHSSIALTDVFADEIILLKKRDGETIVVPVPIPTFGADPSEIMIRVFDSPDSIGKRAYEYLERLVTGGTPLESAEIKEWMKKIGAGYYRSELRNLGKDRNAL
ncbi:MAG: AAA family ATPase [Nitrospirae bacterium]|nr:AAA family ATPase [Nitrospirota bacterium]